ncbi:hypothetical protein [Amycolatopsis jiangsuensis]|uniref:Response regulator of citrate/malate metabolism n=1 Tax=Amycolatopsis jiangsuensis TaxID=1181879 RepID=A0A840J7K4_9PSEU|nr:hypothetical protein [Amycolatopsis jiangsuensis]MBB4689585.1 response regulator of citrate/malate metabolism [Amycolatopsis jiangsuensis]
MTCINQAVLDPRWFRHHADVTTVARNHGIYRATGYRYLDGIVTATLVLTHFEHGKIM